MNEKDVLLDHGRRIRHLEKMWWPRRFPGYRNDSGIAGLWLFEEAGSLGDDTLENNNLVNNEVIATTDSIEDDYAANFQNLGYLYITNANQTGLGITGAITICAWVKLRNSPTADVYVVSKFNPTGNQRGYALVVRADGTVGLIISTNGTNTFTAYSRIVLSTAIWYHLCVVFNGVDLRVFINGALDENGANNPLAQTGTIFSNTSDFRIGARGDGSGLFDGFIDEVAVFSRPLNYVEVANVFNFGI